MKKPKPEPEAPALGRPPMGETTMRKVLVTLDQDTIDKAKKLGKGNLSAGIRAAFLNAIRKS